MKDIEDRLRRALHNQAEKVNPASNSWEDLSGREQRPSRIHPSIVALIVLAAVAAILGTRVALGPDRILSLATPDATPTFTPSPTVSLPTLPSPSLSATPTPSVAPTGPGHWLSPDGKWSVDYPTSWYLVAAGSNRWNITNYKPGSGEGSELSAGQVKMTLTVAANSENWTLESLQAHYCQGLGDPAVKVTECKNTTYGDKTWAWVALHDEVSGGATTLVAGLVAEGVLYQAFAIVPDGSGSSTGKTWSTNILESFRID